MGTWAWGNPDLSADRVCRTCGGVLEPHTAGDRCVKCAMESARRAAPATVVMSPGGSSPEAQLLDVPVIHQIEILGVIGQGGMGAVYKARQTHLDRIVAVKVIRLDIRGDLGIQERFEREARALARLNHPNIVTVHDFGRSGEQCYLVMEFVDGVNLRQAMSLEPFTSEQGMHVIGAVCDALQYAHSQGIVHRDMKPENILIDGFGRVKIADFGLARLADGVQAAHRLTTSGQVMGTLHYMAPEQFERPMEVDHRADIYSLGVIFYEMLTRELPLGRFPLPSERSPSDVRLDDIVLRALEKEPGKRYQSAVEILHELDRIRTTPTPSPPPVRENATVARSVPDSRPGIPLQLDRAAQAAADVAERPAPHKASPAGPYAVPAAWPPKANEPIRDLATEFRSYGYGLLSIAFLTLYAGLQFDIFGTVLPVFLATLAGGMSCGQMSRKVFKKFIHYDDAVFRKFMKGIERSSRAWARAGMILMGVAVLLFALAGVTPFFVLATIGTPFCAIGGAEFYFHQRVGRLVKPKAPS